MLFPLPPAVLFELVCVCVLMMDDTQTMVIKRCYRPNFSSAFVLLHPPVTVLDKVAGRGGRARVQRDVLAVPERGREHELRVHQICGRGARLGPGWTGALLRCSRTDATSLEGAYSFCAQYVHGKAGREEDPRPHESRPTGTL